METGTFFIKVYISLCDSTKEILMQYSILTALYNAVVGATASKLSSSRSTFVFQLVECQ